MNDKIPLEVLSYSDSLFTNAHDVVADKPVHDGRGTFTHLGVRMEGLETARHLNFSTQLKDGVLTFTRAASTCNTIVLRVRHHQYARIHSIVLDTRFYTRNQTKFIFSVHAVLRNQGQDTMSLILSDLILEGDREHVFPLQTPIEATELVLRAGEGGLTRIHAMGELCGPLSEWNNLLTAHDATVFGASDASYGDPSLVLRPQREGQVMAGWESCRHSCRHRLGIVFREPIPAQNVDVIEVDTYMHCLNPFRAFAILAYTGPLPISTDELLRLLPQWKVTYLPTGEVHLIDDAQLNTTAEEWQRKKPFNAQTVSYSLSTTDRSLWQVLLPMTTLKPDTLHVFDRHKNELKTLSGMVSHLMLIGVPDGGLHRIGIYALNQ